MLDEAPTDDDFDALLRVMGFIEDYERFAAKRRCSVEKCCAVSVKRLSETARLPAYGSDGAAGMDLYADLGGDSSSITIYPGNRKLIPTSIAVELPPAHYGRIAPRSGLAFKNGIDTMAGVIDEDYRGALGVILINLGDTPFVVHHHDRVAQMVVELYAPALIVEVGSISGTGRGEGGFGSTGK